MPKKELIFISRHVPNDGQLALAKMIGFKSIKQINIIFSQDPIRDIKTAKIKEKTISIVAPSYITNQLLNEGYTLIEFVNSPIKRKKMVFCCEGAYIYKLNEGKIEQEYLTCPISIEDQIESSLLSEVK